MGVTKLDAALQGAIAQAVRLGASTGEAARICGLNPATVCLWLRKGAAGKEPYRSFRFAVARARSVFIQRQLAALRRHGRRHWRACVWLLERIGGRRYRRKEPSAAPPPPAPMVGVNVDLRPYAELLRSVPLEAPPARGAAPLSQPSSQPSGPPGPRAAGG